MCNQTSSPAGQNPIALAVIAGLTLTGACANQAPPRTPDAPSPTARVASPTSAETPQAVSSLNGDAIVTVTVRYLQRIALPPALLTVTLEDVSRVDTAAMVIAKQEQQTEGRQVPFTVKLPYRPTQIVARNAYVVRARIEVGGTLEYISTRVYPVLTRGAPSVVEVIVDPVR